MFGTLRAESPVELMREKFRDDNFPVWLYITNRLNSSNDLGMENLFMEKPSKKP
jgi:hypothetical protein